MERLWFLSEGSVQIHPMQPVTAAEKQHCQRDVNAWIRIGGLWGRISKILILISPTNFLNKCTNFLMKKCIVFQTTFGIIWVIPGCSDHSKPIIYLQDTWTNGLKANQLLSTTEKEESEDELCKIKKTTEFFQSQLITNYEMCFQKMLLLYLVMLWLLKTIVMKIR